MKDEAKAGSGEPKADACDPVPEPIREGRWPADDPRRAFVSGVAWASFHLAGATVWPSDRDKAEQAAESRYPGGKCAGANRPNIESPTPSPCVTIPVDVARQIGATYERDQVIVLTYGRRGNITNVVTWGRSPGDKIIAAGAGDWIKESLCLLAPIGPTEDFRREGEAAQKVDQLLASARAAKAAIRSVLTTKKPDDGISNELLEDVCKCLDEAIRGA